jgi:hypothetical protein
VHKIAIFSDELENVKQLNFRLQKFESDNIEFEKDSKNQSAVSAFELNSFIFLDLLFSVIFDRQKSDPDLVQAFLKKWWVESDLPEEERQKIKDLLFILKKILIF